MWWSFFGPLGAGLLSLVIIEVIVVIQGGECLSSDFMKTVTGLYPLGPEANMPPSTFCTITNTIARQVMPIIAMLSGVLFAPGIIAGIVFLFISRSKKK